MKLTSSKQRHQQNLRHEHTRMYSQFVAVHSLKRGRGGCGGFKVKAYIHNDTLKSMKSVIYLYQVIAQCSSCSTSAAFWVTGPQVGRQHQMALVHNHMRSTKAKGTKRQMETTSSESNYHFISIRVLQLSTIINCPSYNIKESHYFWVIRES